MEVTAKLRHLQASPQKVRLVVDLIRGRDVEVAVSILRHTKKYAARPVEKLLRSAVANAENRDEELDIDRLYMVEVVELPHCSYSGQDHLAVDGPGQAEVGLGVEAIGKPIHLVAP